MGCEYMISSSTLQCSIPFYTRSSNTRHWKMRSALTNGLAEVDGVFELLPEDGLGRVARHLEQEEAGVALGQEVVRRVVLVHDL